MKILKNKLTFVFIFVVLVVLVFNNTVFSSNAIIKTGGDITSLNASYLKGMQYSLRITGTYTGNASHLCVVVEDKSGTEVNGWDDLSDSLKLSGNSFDKSFTIGTSPYTSDKSPYYIYVFTDPYGSVPGTGAGKDGEKSAVYILVIDSKGNQSASVDTSSLAPTPPAAPNPSIDTGSQTTPSATTVTDTGNNNQQNATETADKGNGSSGTATTQVTNEQITDALQKAVSVEGNTTVELKAAPSSGTRDIALELPKTAVDTILKSEADSVKIDMGIATLTLDQQTLNSINTAALSEASDAKINISVARVDTSSVLQKYSGQAKKDIQYKIGDRPVYDFTIQAGKTKISDFNGGTVEIRLPYTPKAGENTDAIVIYCIADDGSLKCVSTSRYDPETKTVTLVLSHFSRYAAGYNVVKYTDVPSSAWYSKPVGYLAARNVFIAVSGNKFSPLTNITRADFLVMVMRAYGIEPDSRTGDNFSDAGNKYYTYYLAAAKRLGLVTGTNNRFSPEASITRQDMFVILYRALGKLGKLPEGNSGKSFSSFQDAGSIASYAKDAMKLFAESGITSGDGKNLNPKGTTSRAQAAQVLYNLLIKPFTK